MMIPLDALTSGSGSVRDHALSELLSMDAGSHFSPQYSGERIPLLETVLRARPAGTFINIELKTDMLFDPMWKQLVRPFTGYPAFSVDNEGEREKEAVRVSKLTARVHSESSGRHTRTFLHTFWFRALIRLR